MEESSFATTAAEINRRIEEWANDHLAGRMGNESMKEECLIMLRERYADALGIPIANVQLLNYRIEGTTLTWDGINIIFPEIER